MKEHTPEHTASVPTGRKPFQTPVVQRVSRIEVVTAGSFDLVIPNGAP